METLLEAGVPTGPIYSVDQVFADPQVKHLGIVAEALRTIPFGDTQLVGQPFSMNRTPSSIVSPPPSRGQHTVEDILAELGIGDSESLKHTETM